MAAIPGRPNPWQTIGKLVAALVAAGVLVAGLALPYIGGIGLVAGKEADKFQNTACKLPDSKPPEKTTLLARDGKTVVATLFSQDRVEISLDQIPKYLQDALVATEDRRFYTHHGVDVRGLLRSAVKNTSGDTQGGSTLTMQYVKQIRYYEAGDDVKKQAAAIRQTIGRKIEDAKCAIYIERTLKESKATILQNYLNIAFFGENSYGIQTAARTYFNKPASQLTLDESALLVGMLRAPSSYDPFVNRVAAKERRDEVLRNLVAVHKLSSTEAKKQMALPISLASNGPPKVKQGCANSDTALPNVGFFCEYARNWLENVDGISDQQLQTGGLKIVTTLDPKIQTSTQQQVQKAVPAKSASTAVLPVVDPRTGDVLAMAASKQYGTGTNETEQPLFTARAGLGASTYKLFPLLAALQTGMPSDWTLKTVGNTGKYKPTLCKTVGSGAGNGDANETYSINESLTSATQKSSNTFFLGVADQFFGCHLESIVDVAKKLGITSFDQPGDIKGQTLGQTILGQQRAQQLVLGSVPTSPLELTGAYAAVANEGKFNAPAPVLSITDSSGSALPVKRSPGTQVVAPQVAAQAIDILKGDTKSPGTSASEFSSWYSGGGSVIAGKTGTAEGTPSTKNGAIWFAGLTPKLVATSALINYDNPSAASSGLPGEKTGAAYGDYASKIWLRALKPSLEGTKWTWSKPNDAPGTDVPDVTGDSLSTATQKLQDANFKVVRLGAADNVLCPSAVPLEKIGYFGPKKAEPGATITVCESSSQAQEIYTAPAPPKATKKKKKPGSGSGSSGSGGTGRGGGSGGRPGGGNGHGPGGR